MVSPVFVFYMKYAANQRRISSFVKIVNFVRQAGAKDQICLMAVSCGRKLAPMFFAMQVRFNIFAAGPQNYELNI